jgi:hypothetical protein
MNTRYIFICRIQTFKPERWIRSILENERFFRRFEDGIGYRFKSMQMGRATRVQKEKYTAIKRLVHRYH